MSKKECPSCAMEVEGNPKECPICGYEFPKYSTGFKVIGVLLLLAFILWVIF
ncbi:MAG: hypothetical protein ABEH43_06135 [Flavobacteriales bacterium]